MQKKGETSSVFSVEKPEDSPGFLLWQTTITWQRLVKKALDPYDISHAQFVVLAILLWFEKTKQHPTQVIIANWSKLDKMTISKSLKILASQGLVKRSENAKDSRAKSVYLTVAGRNLAAQLVPMIERVDNEFFKVLDKKEQKGLTIQLNKVILKQEQE